jgi:hypothetical protein
MIRKNFLRELGYEQPLDESPVKIPEGWHNGAVVNTGGNIMCRIWGTREANEWNNDTEFEVIYDVSQDQDVNIQSHVWDDGYGSYVFDHEIRSEDAEINRDRIHSD